MISDLLVLQNITDVLSKSTKGLNDAGDIESILSDGLSGGLSESLSEGSDIPKKIDMSFLSTLTGFINDNNFTGLEPFVTLNLNGSGKIFSETDSPVSEKNTKAEDRQTGHKEHFSVKIDARINPLNMVEASRFLSGSVSKFSAIILASLDRRFA